MKALFFNAKGVLYERLNPHHYLRAFLESKGLQAPPVHVLKEIVPEIKDQIMRGRLIPEIYTDAILKACGVTNPSWLIEGQRAIERDQADITILPGVVSTLETLKGLGFKLGIITDSYVPREKKIGWMRAGGLKIEWDTYSNSRDLQAIKPALSLYQFAMKDVGVSAAESGFVGHHQLELTGAHRIGMTTIAVNCDPTVEADTHLDRFEDLLSLPFLQSVS
ncbi:MAG: HAD family hydrolase [Chloroflexota bacterium]|nr:MAG: HAD family hydrolase [Chloroflexota bacterium]